MSVSLRSVKSARFPVDPQRRAMIAKVQLGRKALQLHEDDYRAKLEELTGKRSAAGCSFAELGKVLDWMKSKGFTPIVASSVSSSHGSAPRRRAADHPSAKKARALWISLAQLGAVRDGRESALEAFGRRQLGVDALAWADQAMMFRLIEALKAIAERHGWSQSIEGVAADRQIWTLKLRLAEALRGKLLDAGRIDANASLGDLASIWRVHMGGVTKPAWTLDGLDRLNARLAAELKVCAEA